LSSLSETESSQFGRLGSLLDTFQRQIAMLSTQPHRGSATSSIGSSQRRELTESLQRLSSLSSEQTGQIHSVEAQSVLNDLEALIDHLLQSSSDGFGQAQKKIYPAMSTSFPNNPVGASEERALKRIKGHLSVSQTVNLNKEGGSSNKVNISRIETC
jgi:hypothetical protein